MFKHSATCVTEIFNKSLVIRIPFYPIYVNSYKVESWHTRGGDLIIVMAEKEAPAVATALPTALLTSIQECYEYSRYPGERS